MKRLADGQEPIDLVPVVVVPVQVQLPLVVVPVEVGEVAVAVLVHEVRAVNLRGRPSAPLPVEFSLGCILFGVLKPANLPRQVFSFLGFIKGALTRAVARIIPADLINQSSTARSRNRGHCRLLSEIILP